MRKEMYYSKEGYYPESVLITNTIRLKAVFYLSPCSLLFTKILQVRSLKTQNAALLKMDSGISHQITINSKRQSNVLIL